MASHEGLHTDGGQSSELELMAEDLAAQYWDQHGRIAPQVTGQTPGHLRERIVYQQYLLDTLVFNAEADEVRRAEISFLQDLMNRIESI